MSLTDIQDIDKSDFYSYECLLTDEERDLLPAVRKFMTADVAPLLLEHWSRATFPVEIVPGMRQLGIAGLPYHGYGCGGGRYLLDGMIAMELARTDCSIATFNGVHAGLSMGSILLVHLLVVLRLHTAVHAVEAKGGAGRKGGRGGGTCGNGGGERNRGKVGVGGVEMVVSGRGGGVCEGMGGGRRGEVERLR